MKIKLIRHGESEANTSIHSPHKEGDYCVNLTPKGIKQSEIAGRMLGTDFISNAMLYCSPYWRTRQTLNNILHGAGLDSDSTRRYEDPRLREVERGYTDQAFQHSLRRIHGWFYYRHQGGESPADCYDRVSSFLESMMRNRNRAQVKNVLIVTHGMVIRCFVMRFLHLTVEQFENMKNPANSEIITIAPIDELQRPTYKTKKWGIDGLSLRNPEKS